MTMILSNDILFHIFIHSGLGTLKNASISCKRIQKILSDKIFWREKAIYDKFLAEGDREFILQGITMEEYLILLECGGEYNKMVVEAIRGGHKDIAKLMLEKGGNTFTNDDYDKMMFETGYGGRKDILEPIIKKEVIHCVIVTIYR